MLLGVPVIDVAPFRSGGLAVRQAVADEVGRAVNDIGFLVITGHGIDPELVAEVQAISNAFFDLPEDEKRKVLRPAPDVTRGYIPLEAESVGRSKGGDARGDLRGLCRGEPSPARAVLRRQDRPPYQPAARAQLSCADRASKAGAIARGR